MQQGNQLAEWLSILRYSFMCRPSLLSVPQVLSRDFSDEVIAAVFQSQAHCVGCSSVIRAAALGSWIFIDVKARKEQPNRLA